MRKAIEQTSCRPMSSAERDSIILTILRSMPLTMDTIMNAFTGYKFGFENIVFDTANYINDQTDLMEQALHFFGSHPEEEIEEDAASEESAEEK